MDFIRLKRNPAWPGRRGGDVARLDGHESHARYRRHGAGCLQRTVPGEQGDRLPYYHRQVNLRLAREKLRRRLDHEPQRAGEDEVATAVRLPERVLAAYPRAFPIILAETRYAQAPFLNFLLAPRKHAVIVLKDARRDLFHAGLTRHRKTSIQRAKPQVFWARVMAAEIYRAPAALIRRP